MVAVRRSVLAVAVLVVAIGAVLLRAVASDAQLTTVPPTSPTTPTTLDITTFPTIVPTLPPFTTAPVPTRPPATTVPPPTTAPPATEPPTEPPATEPPATFRPNPTTPRPTTPPTTEPPPIPEPPPAVAAPPPGAVVPSTLPTGTGMTSDKVATEPGGVVTLTGGGCTPGAPVDVKLGDREIGTIQGTPDGRFIAILTLPQVIEVGRYDITITCGVVHTLPIDIVVASHLDSGNSQLVLVAFLGLVGVAVVRRGRRLYRSARPVVGAADRPVEP